MRGVVSAGMVGALEKLGLRDCFDAVYGTSAGAISGAYFIAGQARYGTTIYEDINNRKFIDLWRLAQGTPVVSLEFLLDEVCVAQKPLMFERVLRSDIPLRVLAASISRKSAVVLKDFTDQRDLLDALRASARIPYFAGEPVQFRNDQFLDASLYESIPFRAAIADNATDLMILLTRPLGCLRPNPSWINRFFVVPYLRRIDPTLVSRYLTRAVTYRSEIDAIHTHARGKNLPDMVLVHLPEGAQDVGPFDLSREKLAAGAKAGFSAVYSALGLDKAEPPEIPAPAA